MTNKILKGPKLTQKTEEKCLGEFFFTAAEKFKDTICQIDGLTGEKESFKTVKQRCTRVAMELQKRNIRTSNVIMFCLKNDINNAIPIIATLYLGAQVASLDPLLSARDCSYLISLVKPKLIFVDENSVGTIESSLESLNHLDIELVVVGKSEKYSKFSDFQKPKDEEEKFKPVSVNCRETAFIFFSSGTTGLPKGICVSHFGILTGTQAFLEGTRIKTDVLLHFTSMYWISAAILLVANYLVGSTRVVSSKIDAESFFEIVQNHKVTFAFISTSISSSIRNLKNSSNYDTTSLFSTITGGSAITVQQLEDTRKKLPHTIVVNGYGMTEASAFLTVFNLIEYKLIYRSKTTSVGRPGVGITLKVVDPDTGKLLGPNERGELCFKSSYYMNCYYNAVQTQIFDNEGFIMSGDICYYDEDHFIYIVDRIKEMFKYKCWHVVPASVEAVFYEHPDVKEVVVFGVPHEEDGGRPAACVVLHENAKASVEEIQSYVEDKVNEIQKLRGGVLRVDAIPKTPTGKVVRRKVVEMFLERRK